MSPESGRNLAAGAFTAAVTAMLTMIVAVCGFGGLFIYALKQISSSQ